jgi:hypothetical protein
MGSGWLGSGGLGSGWFDALGSGWTGTGDGGAGVPTFAMRADRPLADIVVAPHNVNAKFPDRAWDPDLLAITVLPEFLDQQDTQGKHWKEAVIDELQPGPTPITLQTISQLLPDMIMKAVTERPEALGEIVQEHNNFQARYLHLLNMSPSSHPCTFLMMKLAARVGEFAMMSLKRLTTDPSAPPDQQGPWDLRSRPRPSQICPTLFPPVPVPGHSTYPAGHALIAWLTTQCLKDIPALQTNAYTRSLEEFADRVGENRVYAGLHFQEDIDAGKKAGIKIHEFLAPCMIYQKSLMVAQSEWT